MDRYPWDPALETGNERIDTQHKDLFQLANALEACVRDDACRDVVGDAVFRLVDHVVEHFRDEEALMIACHYPDLETHRTEHKTLAEQTIAFTVHTLEGDAPRVAELALVVSSWLREHILDFDRRLAEYLRDCDAAKQ